MAFLAGIRATASAVEPDESEPMPPFSVPSSEPMRHFLFLAHGASAFRAHEATAPPPRARGCARVVCISDTHNEHGSLVLPDGDVLVHAGDCLTESGARHVQRDRASGAVVRVRPSGVALFEAFARWFASRRHARKVLVAGNHDLVLQGLGPARVQRILDAAAEAAATAPPPVYLCHGGATVAGLRFFGSPYAPFGGKNDAFRVDEPGERLDDLPPCDVVVQHMPPLLPSKRGVEYDDAVVGAVARARAQLHVSGHCHWAHGVYFAPSASGARRAAYVVASVCEAEWKMPAALQSASGVRGDAADKRCGGYNIFYPPIVCDVRLPADGGPSVNDDEPAATLASEAAPRARPDAAAPARRDRKGAGCFACWCPSSS